MALLDARLMGVEQSVAYMLDSSDKQGWVGFDCSCLTAGTFGPILESQLGVAGPERDPVGTRPQIGIVEMVWKLVHQMADLPQS